MSLQFLLQVYACFIEKSTNKPLTGENVICRLYDSDLLEDDLLATAIPDNKGVVHYRIDPKNYRDFDSFLEKLPDLYIEIESDGEIIFKTPIAKNVNALDDGTFNLKEGEVVNLGTFLV